MSERQPTRNTLWLALGYLVLVTYGSLYPLAGWHPVESGWAALLGQPLGQAPWGDLVVNLLVYMPFGFLSAQVLRPHLGGTATAMLVMATGVALSLGLERLQMHLPARHGSLFDTLLNTISTAMGLLASTLLTLGRPFHRWARRVRDRWLRPEPVAQLGLFALLAWLLSQWLPLFPTLDVGELKNGIKPLWHAITGQRVVQLRELVLYALELWLVGLLALQVLRPRGGWRHRFVVPSFLLVVLVAKVGVVSRVLSAEALGGWVVAGCLLVVWPRTGAVVGVLAAIFLTALFLLMSAWWPIAAPGAPLYSFNWIPFASQAGGLNGIGDLVDALWPMVALSFWVQTPRRWQTPGVFIVASVAVGLVLALTEWRQQWLPGRHGDITDVVVGLAGFMLPWFAHSGAARGFGAGRRWSWRVVPPVSLALFTGFLAAALWGSRGADPDPVAQLLPNPGALADWPVTPVRTGHPRLPAPTLQDRMRLDTENPAYVQQLLRRARGGEGDFESVIQAAYLAPGSQDIDRLFQRLMALQFQWRGHEQARPLAQAYDWLHGDFSQSQRRALQNKLIEGCNYLIEYIRRERLSPYNVYLYNRPLQALVASTLAVQADHPEAGACMAFTEYYLRSVMLPVWRQVMGQNGGWHEGGEYVGIGIGSAVYRIPAMWEAATGESWFESEPQLEGFLDFLVQRQRPDGDYAHWGDAGFFRRQVPDRVPLALRYRHAAAYGLGGCPTRIEPSAWPWGPLPDPSLCAASKQVSPPLGALFDGIGLAVVRSGWSPDSTFASLRGGDNYWSHSHLDQGAITLFKGAPLLIDSGLYYRYGSDHHLSYAYQTVAHNSITVTDPNDRAAWPKFPNRLVANDGGQRRVGSGWGAHAAPLTLGQWQQQRAEYHTGRMRYFQDQDGLVVAVTDISPAYANRHSAKGAFYARTPRTRQVVRVLVYDRLNDLFVVYDRVIATRARFAKRVLFHSLNEPRIEGDRFEIAVAPEPSRGWLGGQLHGWVVQPRQAILHSIGGRGWEFYVDGVQYDDGGAVFTNADKRGHREYGSWRLEVSPERGQLRDDFLVVLAPRLHDDALDVQVAATATGVQIEGPQRNLGLQIGELGSRIVLEYINQGEAKFRTVPLPGPPAQPWWQRLRSHLQ